VVMMITSCDVDDNDNGSDGDFSDYDEVGNEDRNLMMIAMTIDDGNVGNDDGDVVMMRALVMMMMMMMTMTTMMMMVRMSVIMMVIMTTTTKAYSYNSAPTSAL